MVEGLRPSMLEDPSRDRVLYRISFWLTPCYEIIFYVKLS